MECLKIFQQQSTLTTISRWNGEGVNKKVVENMKSELARKAEQVMELFQTEFASSTTEQKDAEEK